MFSIASLFEIIYPFSASDVANIFLQNWGDFTDMSQAMLIYVVNVCDVLLICWCGSQLTQQVRQKGILVLLLVLLAHCIHNVYWASNQLRNYGKIWILSIFLPYQAFCIKFTSAKLESWFLCIWWFVRCYSSKMPLSSVLLFHSSCLEYGVSATAL